MKHLTSVILLGAYGLVSLLGHAGFDVLGLHSHKHSDGNHVSAGCTGNEHHVLHCAHGHNTEHSTVHGPHNVSQQFDGSSGDNQQHQESNDCTVCKFFGLLKTQIIAVSSPMVTSALVYREVKHVSDGVFSVDYTLLPMPRGPPSLAV
jgi:hypothetical protein